jgi:hypothetical protein
MNKQFSGASLLDEEAHSQSVNPSQGGNGTPVRTSERDLINKVSEKELVENVGTLLSERKLGEGTAAGMVVSTSDF